MRNDGPTKPWLAATARASSITSGGRGYRHIELDFAAWIVDLGRFALQVKGGHYLLIDGEWRLKTRDGPVPIETSPLDETWLAALDLHDDIEERAATPYNAYVIPVLLFADMEARSGHRGAGPPQGSPRGVAHR